MRLIDAVGMGATFSASVLVGLAAGVVLAQRTGASLWVVGGLAAGFIVGAILVTRRLLPFVK